VIADLVSSAARDAARREQVETVSAASAPSTSAAPASAAPAVSHPGSEPLYDSGRQRYYVKPRWRGWSHLVWFEASLVVGTLIIVAANGWLEVTCASIYAASVSALFGTSALYHRGNWAIDSSRALQRADHATIFLLIAGTATPVFLISAPGTYGLVCLCAVWAFAAGAAGIHLAWMSAPEALVGATFIGLGSAGVLALPPIWARDGIAPALLMLVGGALYILGAILYHRRSPDPSPALFGYHEVFHACVCAAAACQYVAIALFIL
jgi:hemolysin III